MSEKNNELKHGYQPRKEPSEQTRGYQPTNTSNTTQSPNIETSIIKPKK